MASRQSRGGSQSGGPDLDPDPERDDARRPVTGDWPLATGDSRLAAFKRLYRWLNLTLVHQATWPLLAVLFAAPTGSSAETPFPWYAGRLSGPALAAALALGYLAQRPPAPAGVPGTTAPAAGAPAAVMAAAMT